MEGLGLNMKDIVHQLWHRPKTFGKLLVGFVLVLATVVAGVSYFPGQAAHAVARDWTTFLGSNARTGYDAAETTINATTAPNLKLHWTFSNPGHAQITAEVMAANGLLYWGSWDGVLHASDPATGNDVWKTSLGTRPGGCSHNPKGVISSVTVATVPINGTATSVVFVGSGPATLYALDALKGTIIWQTILSSDPASFLYSSTAIYQGSIYIGVASTGDCPLVQAEVARLDASTGQIQNTFKTVPDGGCLGASIWGTLAIDEQTGMIYFGTGNVEHKSCTLPMPLEDSVIQLNASNLSLVAFWRLPKAVRGGDTDYGSNPTLFQATINGVTHAMVGIVNKNGYYYALDRTNIAAGPLWSVRISVGGPAPAKNAPIAAGAFDGTNLYVAGSLTTVDDPHCSSSPGSLLSLDPNTGAIHWEDCLASAVLAPVIAVPGLLVVGTGNTMIVVDSSTGQTLYSYQDTLLKGFFWGAAMISNGVLYEGSRSGTMFAFGL
jgi:outer membrane protein assembly factor BamB